MMSWIKTLPAAKLGFAGPSGTHGERSRTHLQHIIDALHNAEATEKLMAQLSVELTGEVPSMKANAADMPQPEPEGVFPQLGEAGRRINACLSTIAAMVQHIRGSV